MSCCLREEQSQVWTSFLENIRKYLIHCDFCPKPDYLMQENYCTSWSNCLSINLMLRALVSTWLTILYWGLFKGNLDFLSQTWQQSLWIYLNYNTISANYNSKVHGMSMLQSQWQLQWHIQDVIHLVWKWMWYVVMVHMVEYTKAAEIYGWVLGKYCINNWWSWSEWCPQF